MERELTLAVVFFFEKKKEENYYEVVAVWSLLGKCQFLLEWF